MCASVSLFSKPSRKGAYIGINLGLDPDVAAWNQAVIAAGSTISATTLAAANRLVQGMKRAGLWDKMYMVDLCAGANLTAALVRLKVPTGVARGYVNNNFVNGDYTESIGLTGNGTTKYLDSLLDPVSQTWNLSSLSLWAYTRTQGTNGVTSAMMGNGTSSISGNLTTLGWLTAGTEEAIAIGVSASGALQYGGKLSPSMIGWLGGGTNGSRSNTYYINGVATGVVNAGTGVFQSSNIAIYAINNGGVVGSYTTRILTTKMIGQGLSASDSLALYSLVQSFETTLKRNV